MAIPLRSPSAHLPQNAFQFREDSCEASHLAVVEYEYEHEYEDEDDPDQCFTIAHGDLAFAFPG